jgi:hypothetical protein
MVASGSDVALPAGRRSVRRDAWQVKIRRSILPANLKLLAFALSTYGNHTGKQNRPGLAALADDIRADMGTTPLSRKTLGRWLDQLESAGWITKISRGGGGQKGAKIGADYWLTELVQAVDSGQTTGDIAPQGMSRVKAVDEPVDNRALGTSKPSTRDIDPPLTSSSRKDPKELLDPQDQNLVFVSSHVARDLDPEIDDPFAADDPYDRTLPLPADDPPGHVRQAFAGLRLVISPAPEPDLALCAHGVLSGLKFGGGELACCPPPEEP